MKSRAGFTLIEVMVAVTIAAVVMLAAREIFAGVADTAKAVTTARHELDRRSNARRWLKAAFLSLEPPFEGRARRVAFSSWQRTSGGWFERQSIELTQDGGRLLATHGTDAIQLADSATAVTFDYLLTPGADTKWVSEWVSPVSAPLAIRMRIARCGDQPVACVDTLLFLVKERG